jgi:cobalamin-dependent methionine synthase I
MFCLLAFIKPQSSGMKDLVPKFCVTESNGLKEKYLTIKTKANHLNMSENETTFQGFLEKNCLRLDQEF